MGNSSLESTRIKENLIFLLADTEEHIRKNLKRLSCNGTATSGSSRPSLPVQPSRATVQQPDENRNTAPKMVQFREEGAFVPLVDSANGAYVGVSRFPYPSNEPFRVVVGEPVNRKSEVVVKVASTSRGCAGVGSDSRLQSIEPTVEIVEQPLPSRRFRYDSEIVSAGAIQGVRRKKDQKSFPKIKIGNYTGPAEITVSLVCKDKPYRVHPNGIVGKKKTPEEKFTYIYVKQVQITRDNCVIQFDNLGIRIVKPRQIEEALRLRKVQSIDPFGQGFKFNPKNDDLQAVRLCFHVKLAQKTLEPVISDVIYHSKNGGCLQIDQVIQTCRCHATNTDEPKVIFKSQQLNPKDVEVVFYEKENGEVWEHCVRQFDLSDTRGIVCAVPSYPRASIEYDTVVNVVLRRPSDGTCGDPKPFTYYANADAINEKKRKKANKIVQKFVMDNWTPPSSLPPDNDAQNDKDWLNMPGPFDVNLTMPGPSSVNSAVPRLSSVNPAVPGLSSANPAVPGLSSVNPAVPGLSSVNPAVPGLSSVNPAVPGLSSVNPAVPGLSSVSPAVPGLNYLNPFSPEPTEWESMQTNQLMSPVMVPMPSILQPISVTEDKDFFSLNGHLDNDDEYPSEDSLWQMYVPI